MENTTKQQLEKSHTLCVTWWDGTRAQFKHTGMLDNFRRADINRMRRGLPIAAINGTFTLIKDWGEAEHSKYTRLLHEAYAMASPGDNFDMQHALVSMRDEAIALGFDVDPLPW